MGEHNLSEWVDLHTDELFSWASYKVSNDELAKDLVQDTFLAAAEKLDSFKGDSTPKTWLFSILNYKIIDHYRKKVKEPVKMEEDTLISFFNEDNEWKKDNRPNDWNADEQHLLDDDNFQQILKQCMDALPDKWSTIMKLKYLTGNKGEEICQELGISTTNFWQIMHRARLNLRECIDNNWFNQ
jgi:RNA polymerase sigma-70 factor (ECF subfamily)